MADFGMKCQGLEVAKMSPSPPNLCLACDGFGSKEMLMLKRECEACVVELGITEVLFIFSGAFTGMNDIIKNRVGDPWKC